MQFFIKSKLEIKSSSERQNYVSVQNCVETILQKKQVESKEGVSNIQVHISFKTSGYTSEVF